MILKEKILYIVDNFAKKYIFFKTTENEDKIIYSDNLNKIGVIIEKENIFIIIDSSTAHVFEFEKILVENKIKNERISWNSFTLRY